MKHSLLLVASALAIAACSPTPPSSRTVDASPTPPPATVPAATSAPAGAASRDKVPHAQLPDTVTPASYVIDMVIDPEEDGMSGEVEIVATINEETDGFWIHAKAMDIDLATVEIDGETYTLSYDPVPADEAPSGLAWMASETRLPEGPATIRLRYSTPYNQNLNSAYKVVRKTDRGEDAYIVTQMEPLGAREAFPGFDEPKFKQPFQLSITAPDGNVVVSNTPKTMETPVADGMIRHDFAQTLPLPTYLIAFAVGPYDVVEYEDLPSNSVRKRPLAFRGIAARGEGKRLDYALENTNGLLTALEEYFGTEYPYEKLDLIAAPDYAFGAMENPGLIVYREYLLLLDDNAPLSQKRAYARVHSHELAHQWFGNLVTPVWWEDIWLNEAFATWMGNKGLTLWRPEGDFDNVTLAASLDAMNIDTLSTTRRVREPLARSENVMDQFDGITYRKGGGVLDMFESYVGVENFQRGVRLHMERYANSVATADDFFQSIADGSGNADVVSAMKSFVDQPGLPLVNLRAGEGELRLAQSRYAPLGSKTRQGEVWEIPIVVKYGVGDDVREFKTLMKDSETTVADLFRGEDADWIMPNADGAGYYRFTLDADGWAALLDNLDRLTTKEALVTQDSLVAAFRAGEVEADTFLAGMRAFANHPEFDVANGSTQLLGFVHDQFPDARPGLAAYLRETYGQRYRTTRETDTLEGNLLAPRLGAMLAGMGEDTEARNYLLRMGTLYLGLGTNAEDDAKKSDVPSNILGSAFAQVMQQQPKAAYAPLLDLASNGSPLEKSAALGALTQTPDADQAQALLDLALAEDSPLTGRQTGTIISGLLRNPAHADMTWEWYKAIFAAYMEAKVPDVRRGRAPLVAGGFCSQARRDEAEAFFTANAEVIPGYERSLAQVLETIELCAALKAEQGASLVAALGEG